MADWSLQEVDLIIADYFSMLSDELSRIQINKTHHRNSLVPLLQNRPGSSIEFKHQNISAVLVKLGLPFIQGYKPRWNYQKLLEERVIAYVAMHRPILEPTFVDFANSATSPTILSSSIILQSAPFKPSLFLGEDSIPYQRRPIKVNYLEREQRNSLLGLQGEQLVMDYEREELIRVGKESLAEKVEWISKNDDGAGFDILSKHINGKDKYIEVKTTKLGKETPIFFSKNEYEFAQQTKEDYHLFRLFHFSKAPKLFIVNGGFDTFCQKEAIQFKGYFS